MSRADIHQFGWPNPGLIMHISRVNCPQSRGTARTGTSLTPPWTTSQKPDRNGNDGGNASVSCVRWALWRTSWTRFFCVGQDILIGLVLCESHEMHASLDLRYHHSVGHFVIWYALFHSTASRVYLPCTTHSHVFLFCTSFHSKWRLWKGCLLPRTRKPLLYHSTLFHFIYVFVKKKMFAGCLCDQKRILLVWRKRSCPWTGSER